MSDNEKTSAVLNGDDVKAFYIPATRLASENSLGNLANMIIIGKVLSALEDCGKESVAAALKKVISAKHADMLEINAKAIELGAAYEA